MFLLLSLSGNALAQDEPSGPVRDQAQNRNLPVEIVVTPTMRLGDLRKLVERAQDNLFARFNALNDDDDYNINCFRYATTGTHIRVRICVPKFLELAKAENASEAMFSMATDPYGSPYLLSNRELESEKSREYEVLEDKMEQFAEENQQFRNAAENLIILQREYLARKGRL